MERPEDPIQGLSDEYDFDHGSRGVALIANNTFEGKHHRRGAIFDSGRLDTTFRHLGFKDIRPRMNLTVSGIMEWFRAVASEDHTDADCLVCAISSHGGDYDYVDPQRLNVKVREDVICCTDGSIFTRDLVEIFNDFNCPSLKGKPRIFILQACRGTQLDPGVEMKDFDEVDAWPSSEPPYTVNPAPCFQDFLIVYSTPPGFSSFRRSNEGSWFVNALCDVTQKTNLNTTDVNKILRKVINIVAVTYHSQSDVPEIGNEKKQCPCLYSMLTKDVYFRTKTTNMEPIRV